MPRYRLTLAYDGTDFVGWQKQEPPMDSLPPSMLAQGSNHATHATGEERERTSLRTVQQAVEDAVRQVVNQPVSIVGASRTDSGVHAWHQTAAFTVDGEGNRPPDERLALAINARLPGDVLCRGCVRTRDDFDPIGDCIGKGYRYSFHNGAERPLWDRRYVKHVWSRLDEAAMDAAARVLEGEHDFAAFAAAGHGRESTVRTIYECRTVRAAGNDSRVEVHVSGNGFLWNMVRIIAGTLMEVGLGRKSAADVRRAVETGSRTLAGPTLGAEGLCLMWQRYPEDPA
ncbi:MAG: tRNA pseudouridine synthase A [Phycisphaerae bacterium]|nr:tRNA pseudouridine synthase A [Phycisphaerae bacterium]